MDSRARRSISKCRHIRSTKSSSRSWWHSSKQQPTGAQRLDQPLARSVMTSGGGCQRGDSALSCGELRENRLVKAAARDVGSRAPDGLSCDNELPCAYRDGGTRDWRTCPPLYHAIDAHCARQRGLLRILSRLSRGRRLVLAIGGKDITVDVRRLFGPVESRRGRESTGLGGP